MGRRFFLVVSQVLYILNPLWVLAFSVLSYFSGGFSEPKLGFEGGGGLPYLVGVLALFALSLIGLMPRFHDFVLGGYAVGALLLFVSSVASLLANSIVGFDFPGRAFLGVNLMWLLDGTFLLFLAGSVVEDCHDYAQEVFPSVSWVKILTGSPKD
jgi:hypothetical protein